MGLPDHSNDLKEFHQMFRNFKKARPKTKRKFIAPYNDLYCRAKNLIKYATKWESSKVSFWMATENPLLGGVSPDFLFAMGRGHKVIEFIEGQLYEAGKEVPSET